MVTNAELRCMAQIKKGGDLKRGMGRHLVTPKLMTVQL